MCIPICAEHIVSVMMSKLSNISISHWNDIHHRWLDTQKDKVIANNFKRKKNKSPAFGLSFKTTFLLIQYIIATPIFWVGLIAYVFTELRLIVTFVSPNAIFDRVVYVSTTISVSVLIAFIVLGVVLVFSDLFAKFTFKTAVIVAILLVAPMTIYFEAYLGRFVGLDLGEHMLFQIISRLALAFFVFLILYNIAGFWADPGSVFYTHNNPENRSYKSGDVILYVQARDHYVEITTAKEKKLLRRSFSKLLEELKFEKGARVHRSYWVHKRAVLRTEKDGSQLNLVLIDGTLIPVSKTYRIQAVNLVNS